MGRRLLTMEDPVQNEGRPPHRRWQHFSRDCERVLQPSWETCRIIFRLRRGLPPSRHHSDDRGSRPSIIQPGRVSSFWTSRRAAAAVEPINPSRRYEAEKPRGETQSKPRQKCRPFSAVLVRCCSHTWPRAAPQGHSARQDRAWHKVCTAFSP